LVATRRYLPDHLKKTCHVYESGDDVFDAMLNQTNIGTNNNKFYVIQLLESDDKKTYHCFTRWGRVGVPGQQAVKSTDGSIS
jgi:poly [ADP-ribose] polymerase 2/3/4